MSFVVCATEMFPQNHVLLALKIQFLQQSINSKIIQGNVQPLRNAQRWEGEGGGGVIHFFTERYWKGKGV